MPTTLFILAVMVASMILIVALLRSGRLREKYAALWVVIGLTITLLAAVPQLLGMAAALLGFEVPSNLLFVLAIFLLLGVTLHLSMEISRLEDETRTLAEEVALLNLVVDSAGLTRGPDDDAPSPQAGPRPPDAD
ncbi:DUF2304 domain-containing protein [Actinomyces slackii]|uniref:Uncharacterized conserved protein n=1 Tax=Actinomyces slackii TaxID=52774 RepID=A0A3S4SV45_9ACTO|nr:DUF2304 domain-containing protein [Actinomyces slackii]VEG75853.1 Uncharacterized conserved protein [Actinomyces slackii]